MTAPKFVFPSMGLVAPAPASGGYSEFNVRNNSTGDTFLGNNVEMLGSGWANINLLGSAPTNSISTLDNLKIGGGTFLPAAIAVSAALISNKGDASNFLSVFPATLT